MSVHCLKDEQMQMQMLHEVFCSVWYAVLVYESVRLTGSNRLGDLSCNGLMDCVSRALHLAMREQMAQEILWTSRFLWHKTTQRMIQMNP